MITDSLPPRANPADPSLLHSDADRSYLDWPAILAGSIFALALSFLLISFGAGLGLSMTSPYGGEGVSSAWLAIAAGIWFAWVMVTGFGAGGYLCGRMRRKAGDATADEVEVRDGTHGLTVWATGTLVGAVLAAMGVGGLFSAGTSAVGTVTEVASSAASSVASSDYFANLMLRNEISAPQAETTAPEASEGSDAATAPAAQSADSGATTFTGIDPAVQQTISGIIARTATSGEMAERDRSYLAQLVAANTGLDEAAARARVDEVNAEIDDVRAAALAAVEKTRIAGVVFGFIAAATLLIGAVAAFLAAAAGGRHRDEGLGFDFSKARR